MESKVEEWRPVTVDSSYNSTWYLNTEQYGERTVVHRHFFFEQFGYEDLVC